MKLKIEKAMLVYQAGLANVFAVDEITILPDNARNARRLLQGDFRSCAMLARGMELAGTKIATAHCNRAGDIATSPWSWELNNAPFSESIIRIGMAFTPKPAVQRRP